ncbi:MAG: hypothetical protein HN348_12255 [Proteobacteria bacterium]|nr:hypothetical protein [Pseudomonadota bacterium]
MIDDSELETAYFERLPLEPNLNKACLPAKMEPIALEGALSESQVACMERSIGEVNYLCDRDRLSLSLIANAHLNNDSEAWEEYVKAHLVEIDGTNPALAYRYAFFLYDEGDYAQASNWAGVALAYRSAWTGQEYLDRVFSLYELRAASGQAIWRAVAEADESEDSASFDARLELCHVAHEWQIFAEETQLDSTVPIAVLEMTGFACEEN